MKYLLTLTAVLVLCSVSLAGERKANKLAALRQQVESLQRQVDALQRKLWQITPPSPALRPFHNGDYTGGVKCEP